jgi:hypothetical protein
MADGRGLPPRRAWEGIRPVFDPRAWAGRGEEELGMTQRSAWYVPALAALVLAGCGARQDDLAVAACRAAIAERLAGKSWTIENAEFKAGYKVGDPGLAEIVAPVYFDRGLPAEKKQTVTCRVQFDPNNAAAEPSVIGLVFQW